jgi:protein LSM12
MPVSYNSTECFVELLHHAQPSHTMKAVKAFEIQFEKRARTHSPAVLAGAQGKGLACCSSMDAQLPKVGTRVRVTTAVNEVFEGVVYTVDPRSDMIVLRVPAAAGEQRKKGKATQCQMRMVNRIQITGIETLAENAIEDADDILDIKTIRMVTDEELDKKEQRAFRDAAKAMAQINKNATPEGQATFDVLAKTMECEWHGESIIVLEQVCIDPPYATSNCRRLKSCPQAALDRVCKVSSSAYPSLRELHAVLACREQQRGSNLLYPATHAVYAGIAVACCAQWCNICDYTHAHMKAAAAA